MEAKGSYQEGVDDSIGHASAGQSTTSASKRLSFNFSLRSGEGSSRSEKTFFYYLHKRGDNGVFRSGHQSELPVIRAMSLEDWIFFLSMYKQLRRYHPLAHLSERRLKRVFHYKCCSQAPARVGEAYPFQLHREEIRSLRPEACGSRVFHMKDQRQILFENDLGFPFDLKIYTSSVSKTPRYSNSLGSRGEGIVRHFGLSGVALGKQVL